jgi:hypothetical protein
MKLTVLSIGTLAASLTLGASVALAAGGGISQGASPRSSTTTITVTIPGVVGIDIESDLAFDLNSYLTSSTPTGGACPDNTFPPPAGCTGAARYDATATSTTAGVPGTAPTTGNIWMSVFCNKAIGTLDLTASTSAFASSPGFATTAIRVKRSTANDAAAVGFTTSTSLSITPASIGVGTLPATFGWTRADQLFDMSIPNASSVSFVDGTFTTTATFTISKS